MDLIENSAPDLIENFGHHSVVTANNATQQLTKQLVLNLKSNWPSLSNTINSQHNSSLDLEELTVDHPSQKGLTENQSLVIDMLTCSKDNCGFKTKHKRCLDLHIKGNR